MKLHEKRLYCEDINYIADMPLPWDLLKDKEVLLTGASGMIGSCLVDVLIQKNKEGLNCSIYAVSRDKERAKERFKYCWEDTHFHFIPWDVNNPFGNIGVDRIDYVIHLASNTHPVAYATDPIGTIKTNIIGTDNILKLAVKYGANRVAFASSNEIYGENRGDVELFDETYCGYIDSNTMRAGYPESKRCGEALCQAYRRQYGMNVVIPRFTRTYGPTMLQSDTKAVSQFIKNGLEGTDIILKSEGTQYYSYTHVTDAVSGLLTVLLRGEDGEAYNIADEKSDVKLKDLAAIIARICGVKVVFELPDEIEKAGYSKATKARLDAEKLKKLGWIPRYNIEQGLQRTIDIFRERLY